MRIDDRDLRMMERLVRAQSRSNTEFSLPKMALEASPILEAVGGGD